MPVYRYRRTGINIEEVKGQVPPADASSVSAGDIAPDQLWDITAPTTSLDDLNEYMAARGWTYVSTDPTDTPAEDSAGDIVHQDLSGAGTNTHAQIDTHVGSTSNPHSVTASQAGAVPAITSVDNEIMRFDGTGGDAQGSGCTISDNQEVVIPSTSGVVGLEVGDTSFAIQMGLDSGGTAYMGRKGTAGTWRVSPNSDNPQWLFGNNGTDGGAVYIDSDAATGGNRPMRLNTLSGAGLGAPVYVGQGGYLPFVDGNTPLGGASNRYLRAYANHLVSNTDVFSGATSLDDATFVVAQAGTYDLTLPAAVAGYWYIIERQGTSGTINLLPDSGDTINGGSSLALDGSSTYIVFAEDATDWRAIKITTTELSDTAPADVTKATASAGTATDAARRDHKHDVTTGTAGAATPGDSAQEGSATSLSLSDHQHSLPAFGSGAGTFCEGDDTRLSDDRTADGLRTATTVVSIGSATAPSANQILKATSGTAATWQNDPQQFDAIVAPSGGDYTSVYDAFNAGAVTVYVRPGIYYETNTIVLPSRSQLVGSGQATIDFNGGSYRIECDGSGGTQETAGTISVSTDSNAVTGVGTSFTNLSPGNFIKLGNYWAQIGSITDDTNLVLATIWRGIALSGVSYIAQAMNTGVSISHMTVIGSAVQGIYLRACFGISLNGNGVIACVGNNIEIVDSYGAHIEQTFSRNGFASGFSITDSSQITLEGSCHADDNDGDGIYINGTSSDIKVSNSSATGNGVDGITVEGTSERTVLLNAICTYNDGKGINTEATTSNTIITNCICSNNDDWGIDWDGAKNIIQSSSISSNTSGGLQGGDDATVSGCHIFSNTGPGINLLLGDDNNAVLGNCVNGNTGSGIVLNSTNCVVIGNKVINNSVNGINCGATSSDNKVSHNEFSGNTAADIVDSGTDNEFAGFKEFDFAADNLENPNNADWTVNALAPLAPDPTNSALAVRRFDDTTEEGVGFTLQVPLGTVNVIFEFMSRAITAPGAAQTVALNLYERGIPNNAAVEAWSSATQLTAIDIPTNAYFQKDIQIITLSSLGLTAGQTHQFELTRDTADAGDTLTGDWALLSVKVRFS